MMPGMKAKLHLEMLAGQNFPETLAEAMRVSTLMDLMIEYDFTGCTVLVSGDMLVCALRPDGHDATHLLAQLHEAASRET